MKKKMVGIVASVLLGCAATIAVAGWAINSYYKDRLLPGTVIGGVDVSGKSKNDAAALLEQSWGEYKEVTLEWNSYKVPLSFNQVRLVYDPAATVELTASSSRLRDLFKQKTTVDPLFTLDQELLKQQIATISAQINIPAQNPEIKYDKNSKLVEVVAGENGQEIDEELLKQRIFAAIRVFDDQPVRIPVRQLQPKLSNSQLENAKLRASRLIDRELVLKFSPEKQEWKIDTEQMIRWMDPSASLGQVQAGWKQIELTQWVADLAKTIDRPAQNASFRFVPGGKVEEFKPEKDGHAINQQVLARDMVNELILLESQTELRQEIELVTDITKPDVTAGQVNDLGIKSLIGRGESWFSGSITNRIFNLKKAADALNGVLIAPGEEFSFNKTVGDISQATGYKSAFIIREGKTILGDGGGVCQTSSTLFRAILNSGLPIDERTAHAYRVSYYEQNYQPGFDATIFQPAPDFKFRNDTPGYVLIQTVFDESKKHLALELYGTNDGRVATVSKARIWDIVAPPPDLYIDDPNMPVGKVVQTEHAARGSKVAFDWKVTRGEEVLQERTFYSNYKAWQGVYLRGTKIN